MSPWRTNKQAFWRGAPLLLSVTIRGHEGNNQAIFNTGEEDEYKGCRRCF